MSVLFNLFKVKQIISMTSEQKKPVYHYFLKTDTFLRK